MEAEMIEFSVIIPLTDGRTRELECIRSWTHEQKFRRSRYQVILVDNQTRSELESESRALLHPQDQFVQTSGCMHRLYQVGATHAVGRVLVFTELHCLADAQCLTELDAWLASHPNAAGACVNSWHHNLTAMARLEQAVFEHQSALWQNPDSWQRVQVRGFAIRRAAYDAVGGIEGELQHFSDVVLAARLHHRGLRIERADRAYVTHFNTADLDHLVEHVREFANGQHRFRLRRESTDWEAYFGLSEAWAKTLSEGTGNGSAGTDVLVLLRTIAIRSVRNPLRLARAAGYFMRVLSDRLISMACGANWRLVRANLVLNGKRLLNALPAPLAGDRIRRFESIWNLLIERELIRDAQKNRPPLEDVALNPGFHFINNMPQPCWDGVYHLELGPLGMFRWLQPFSRLYLRLPAAAQWEVVLETHDSAPGKRFWAAFWNGKPIAADRIHLDGTQIRLRIDGDETAGTHALTLICEPFVPARFGSNDHRALGLPIFSVDCRQVLQCAHFDPSSPGLPISNPRRSPPRAA